jgi:RNA polymerase sigma factor (sigma-70 family)
MVAPASICGAAPTPCICCAAAEDDAMSAIGFPATRWSLIARLPEQPESAAPLLGPYADATGAYLTRKLAGERGERIDDIVQEVLLELLARPGLLARAQPGSGSRFRHYLMTLAWNAARNAQRRARRDDVPAEDTSRLSAPAPEQQQDMDRAWALALLREALDHLERRCAAGLLDPLARTLLLGHVVDGRSLRNLADEHQLSLATASRRLADARRQLHDGLAEQLRLAGELGPDEDPAAVCATLLAALRAP